MQTLRQWLAIPLSASSRLPGPGARERPVSRWNSHVRSRPRAPPAWCSFRWPPPATLRSSRRRSPRLSGCRMSPGATWRGAHARRATGQPTLLVLDNFEQVLDAAPLVGDLLTSVACACDCWPPAGHRSVSGESGNTPSNRSRWMWVQTQCRRPTWYVLPQCASSWNAFGMCNPTSASRPRTALTVTAICQRLDALPLALELAAPWIKVLTAEGLLRRLEHDVLLSTAGARDLPARQQTMNATVAWSYQLLDADEQRAFRRFGALPGLFPIDAAAAVLAGRADIPAAMDEAFRAAVGLIDKSLLLRAKASVVPHARFTTCWKPYGRTPCSSSRPRANGTMPSRASCVTARVKAPWRRRAWLDPRRSSGWIACVKISRVTVAHSRGSSNIAVPSKPWTSRGDCCSSGSFAGMPPKACGGMTDPGRCRRFRPLPNRERSSAPR